LGKFAVTFLCMLTPILCSFAMLGALFTIQSNLCVTGHFWELALLATRTSVLTFCYLRRPYAGL
jgi:hypothetical protein